MTVWMLLALGGGIGALARYGMAAAIHRRTGGSFPAGTLAVNVLGSFLLGLVVTGLAASPWHVHLGALLAIGFLGDFTTFSTFAYEAIMLARDGQRARSAFYLAASVGLGLVAIIAGMICGGLVAAV